MIVVHTVPKSRNRSGGYIGDAVAAKLNEIATYTGKRPVVVAVIPRVLEGYPGEYEVASVDLLIEEEG